jgi:hypothetical protein
MAPNEKAETLIDFIIGDFESAWNAINQVNARSGGNFLFASQAMVLLELACRICNPHQSGQPQNGKIIKDFSNCLAHRDRRYFTELPGSCRIPNSRREFELPSQGSNPSSELIAALFDLVRNGQAHQYQPIIAALSDGKHFSFNLTGAGRPSPPLRDTFANGRPLDHLTAQQDASGDIWVKVRTDVLFIDIREAIEVAGVRSLAPSFVHLNRGKAPHYQFSSQDLESKLRSGGHF